MVINRCLIILTKNLLTEVSYNQQLINVVNQVQEVAIKVIWLQEVHLKVINLIIQQREVAHNQHLQNILIHQIVQQLVVVMSPEMEVITLQMVSITQVMLLVDLEVVQLPLRHIIQLLGRVEVVIEI